MELESVGDLGSPKGKLATPKSTPNLCCLQVGLRMLKQRVCKQRTGSFFTAT
ncbi:hypothetical protein Goari_000337 [Gossypium aridum]|uniref:Uncharacterized protein n=1 Tax=Gossypium aridum TaxID=34290 RepID=A0A7J8YGD5_GOSAI|nr:hypothetical protein [Gossypium aridum]